MDNPTVTKAIMDMTSTLGRIEGTVSATKEKVDAHDSLLKDHTTMLNDIGQRTYHLDSWKNGIIDLVTQEKEKALAVIRGEIKPIQEDLKNRTESKKETKTRFKDLTWDILKVFVGSIITWVALKGKSLLALIVTTTK